MSGLTGTNVSKGSASEKIWWGTVLCLTGIGAIIGIPMILIGIGQAFEEKGIKAKYHPDYGKPPDVETRAMGWEMQGRLAYKRGDLESAKFCYARADELRATGH